MPLERLVTKEEMRDAIPFMKALRAPTDPKPVYLDPPTLTYDSRQCVLNAVRHVHEHGGDAIKGFKMWEMPPPFKMPMVPRQYVAVAHVVVRQANGKYVDVTPPEPGDEGQGMMFVPSSRLFPQFSADAIAKLFDEGLEPRMGAVCNGMVLAFKQRMDGDLFQACPDDLHLWLEPLESTLQKHGLSNWKELGGKAIAGSKQVRIRADALTTQYQKECHT